MKKDDMGFDVSYHPVSEAEMMEWYFGALEDDARIDSLAEKYGINDFYRGKYRDTINVGLQMKAGEYFDKTHSYFVAVVQGFSRTYFYVRGGAFTFAVEANPSHGRYTKSWTDILGREIEQPVANQIIENYCGGVYIPADRVPRLLEDIETDPDIRAELEGQVFGEGTMTVFMKALRHAQEHGLGLLEATEVVEPNPTDLNASTSCSNLFNCDRDGPLLYAETARKQIAQAMAAFEKDGGHAANDPPKKNRGGFFRNLFK
jgi:hypothetical protein